MKQESHETGDLFHKSPRWMPATFNEAALTSEERKILNYLKVCHVGARRAIVVRDVAASCQIAERNVREILKHLTEQHGIALGSSVVKPFGVFLIDTEEELIGYIEQLKGRALSILKRMAVVRNQHLPEMLGQLAMELETRSEK